MVDINTLESRLQEVPWELGGPIDTRKLKSCTLTAPIVLKHPCDIFEDYSKQPKLHGELP